MTLTYHSGERIQGLAYTASNITKDVNFSDVWLSGNTTYADINTSTEKIEFDWDNGDGNTDKQINVDLGSVSTNWIVRFKLNWSVATSSNNAYMYVGLSDNAGGAGVSQNAFAMRFINSPAVGSEYVNFGANQVSGARVDYQGGSGANMTYTTDTDHYVELKKNGTSLTATIWTGSYGGTQVATQTITTTITPSLKYLHFWNSMSANTGTWEGTFEDVKFWNNATSTSGTPTYDYNLANASVWSQDPSDSQFAVSSSDGRLNFLDDENSTGDRTWLDLGTSVSTTKWLLRFKFRFSTLASGTYYYEFDAGLSDTTVKNNVNQNFIGVRCLPASNANLWRPRTCDGSSSPRTGSTANITQSFSTGTDYFVEIKRTSASNWAISLSTTNAYDGDLQDNSYTDASGSTGLRYFKFGDAVTNVTAGADMQGYVDDVEFYNDTTTAVKTAIGDEKPTNVELASRFEETDTQKIYYRMDGGSYDSSKWYELGTLPYAGGRGVFGGGYSGSNINVIDYITIATTGNATDFGDMTVSRRNSGVCSNKTRGLMCGGYTSSDQPSNIIDYITIATPSNSTDFGDMDNTATNGIMGIGSETRALFGGGESGMTNRIAYLTISTPSNSTDFGDLTVARKGGSSTGDGTKGIWMGGEEGGQHGVTMDYVTISTTGNATDWGDLSSGTASGSIGLVSNGTIGLLVTGGSYSNRVDKKTIATNANSVDYGDLTDGRSQAGQCSTETRAVFAGGKYQSGGTSSRNIIDYMAIASGGNATDFGDLTVARYIAGGMSDTGADRP